jgi:hypothetical protein
MKASLLRKFTDDEGTQGELRLENGYTCLTLELPWRNNHANFSCIPAGTYICRKRWSFRFMRWLYEVLYVNGRENILIHSGNWAGDVRKGFKSDVEGCILLGDRISSSFPQGYNVAQHGIFESRNTLVAFMAVTHGEDLELTITGSAA